MKKELIFITLILSLFLIAGCTQKTEEPLINKELLTQSQETKEFNLTASN